MLQGTKISAGGAVGLTSAAGDVSVLEARETSYDYQSSRTTTVQRNEVLKTSADGTDQVFSGIKSEKSRSSTVPTLDPYN